MTLFRFTVLFLVFIALLFSCKKDESSLSLEIPSCTDEEGILVENTNIDITNNCIVMVTNIPLNRYGYRNPIFNPNNENEIIYQRIDYENPALPKKATWKYNFCTNETNHLTDKAFYGLDWSSKDWVIFTSYDQQLYKIKSNGDSLTQLTDNAFFNSHAKWNNQGTAYLYRQSTSPLMGLLISDEFGNIQDTLEELKSIHSWAWDNDRIFFSDRDAELTYISYGEYNLETNEMQTIASNPPDEATLIENLVYREFENKLYWKTRNLFYHDLSTGQVTYLTQGADNRIYGLYDISRTGEQIIASRTNIFPVNECTIETEEKFYLIDIVDKKEREIFIPE